MNVEDKNRIDKMIALVDDAIVWIIKFKKNNPNIVQNRNCWQNVNAHMGKREFVPIGFEMTMQDALKEYGTKWRIPLNVKLIP